MEILSNFASIYCFITFIIGAVFMFIAICVVAMGKMKEPRNKVRFFVKMIDDNMPWLYIKGKDGTLKLIFTDRFLYILGLNPIDFYDMKVDEIKEVFLNLED